MQRTRNILAHIARRLLITALILGMFLISGSASAGSTDVQKHQYQVVHIIDGDTFVASDGNVSFHVRMAGIDAPEKDQAYGKVAKLRLQEMIKGKSITIDPVGKGYDRYGRVLGKVVVDGTDPALTLVQEGLATYYRPSCRDYPEDKREYDYDVTPYLQAETAAKQLKKNIWSDPNIILPCKWRRLEK